MFTTQTLARFSAALFGALLVSLFFFPQAAIYAKEDMMLMFAPSGERAFAYADQHFSSLSPEDYDIERAYRLFKKAGELDPTLPYLFHELARIEFLKGNLPQALALINVQIAMHGEKTPNSYYVRGLIEGYKGEYDAAVVDYAQYLKVDPNNWAAANDYVWVLLKSGRAEEARSAAEKALRIAPDNAWLLNSYAIALYETGEIHAAYTQAVKAVVAARRVTHEEWLTAYPGNDPRVADEGIATLQKATEENIHRLEVELGITKVQ